MTMRKLLLLVVLLPVGMLAIASPNKKEKEKEGKVEKAEPAIIERIIEEGTQRSKVMEIAWWLTEASGPRLTASPGFMRAANWAKDRLTAYGLKNARMEAWGDFGWGWQHDKAYLAMTAPYYVPIIAMPKAWTGSTPGNGPLKTEVVLIEATDEEGFAKYKGKLKGKVVMMRRNDTIRPSFVADGNRYTDEQLEKMANEPIVPNLSGQRNNNPNASQMNAFASRMQRMQQARRLTELVNAEEPALILSMNPRGTDGTIFVQGGGSYASSTTSFPPASLEISSDEYLRMQRLLQNGVPVMVEAEVKTTFYNQDTKGYNVLAEIPGTDPKLKEEVVMLGAHLDSWHASTGATDNAAGSAVMMEAVRIIQSLGIKPRRTIRIALWSGEEQGLYGSRGWVKANLADPANMQPLAAHEKISAYFNLDNGTGKIRGIYCQQNKEVAPIFQDWLKPFAAMGAKTVTIGNTGGTDHLAFDAVGIPGFQFIQDEIEYNTRTHHTNMDSYDHLIPEDLKQAATIVAAFVMNTAQRDEKLPRKPMPEPRPQERDRQ